MSKSITQTEYIEILNKIKSLINTNIVEIENHSNDMTDIFNKQLDVLHFKKQSTKTTNIVLHVCSGITISNSTNCCSICNRPSDYIFNNQLYCWFHIQTQ